MSKRETRTPTITESIGPVDNLESYVKAEWWRQLFNANYLRTDGDVVNDETITKTEIDLFTSILTPSKESSILDLCCGHGRHSLELARRGFTNIVGLDRSHYLVNQARTLNKREGYNITFKEGDARTLPFPSDTFDYIILLGNSFGYFESRNDDFRVLNEAMRVLKPFGTLLIDIADGDHLRDNFQARSWEWIDKRYFVCRERSLSEDGERLISREVISHVRKGVIQDQFYAERLYTQDTLRDLLGRATYANITYHADVITDSKRNQDLGMMAKRIIVSAVAKKEWTTVKTTTHTAKDIVVLMGDPRRPDVVKPDATFDDDDVFTINELKRALSSLGQYHFTYIDKHSIVVQELQKARGNASFVFNLCDEGFCNDASKELHIPCLLEILNLRYTGGTPQCLAYCYDKSLVRGIATEMDIPVPRAYLIKPDDITFIELPLDFPVIVKPNFGDSSFGITQHSVCYDLGSLETAILGVRERFGYNKPMLVEKFLMGKDISVGIIGNPPESYLCLPIIEEDYSALPRTLPRVCGYEAKWLADSPYSQVQSIPANLSEETEKFLVASCIKLFDRLECRDYARFDWRLDANNTPRLLEVNPNPGWCWDGHLAKMAKIAGMSYAQMLQRILEESEKRIAKDFAQ